MAGLTLRADQFETMAGSFAPAARVEPIRQAPNPELSVEVVETRVGFDALEAEWNALFARSGRSTQVFQTFNWCWHWCNHFLDADAGARGTRLAVVAVRRSGTLVLVLPLAIERRMGLRRLVWLGEPVSQYGDAIIDDAEDGGALIAAAWRHLVAGVRFDIAHLRKVRADAAIAPFIGRLGGRIVAACEAPALELSSAPDFATYEQRYSAKARKNRRRLLRRLEEQGAVAIEHPEKSPAASAMAVHAIGLKLAWLEARGLFSPALADVRTRRFFADVAGDGVRGTGCQISVLRVDGSPAGIQVGFACKGRLSQHIIVYDLRYEKAGVGVLQLEDSIRHAYARGYAALDLLAPNDAYKMDWADTTVAVHDHAIPRSVRGHLFARVYLGGLRERLKAVARHLPRLTRTMHATGAML